MTIVITKGDNPGNYIYVDVNADFATMVIPMVPFSKAHSKGQVHKNRQNRYEFSINGTTEKQHIPDLVQAFSQENGGFLLQIGRCHWSNLKTLPSI